MHDLATIKRLNRNPSNNRQDKLAPQPTRHESGVYAFDTRWTLDAFREEMQSPAMERELLESE